MTLACIRIPVIAESNVRKQSIPKADNMTSVGAVAIHISLEQAHDALMRLGGKLVGCHKRIFHASKRQNVKRKKVRVLLY